MCMCVCIILGLVNFYRLPDGYLICVTKETSICDGKGKDELDRKYKVIDFTKPILPFSIKIKFIQVNELKWILLFNESFININ